MLKCKDKAHKNLFRGSWKKRPSKMTHDLLFEMKYGDFLDHLSFLVYCIETNAEVNDYQAYNKIFNILAARILQKVENRGQNRKKK